MSGEDRPLDQVVKVFVLSYAIGTAIGVCIAALAAAWVVGNSLLG